MLFTTEKMLIAQYGVWDIDGDPVTNKAGEPVEYVQVIDLEADEVHRWTMQGVGPKDRPEPMTAPVKLKCSGRTVTKARQDGSTASKLQVRVVGFDRS